MKQDTKRRDKHLLQVEDLRIRLEEAEETLRAIRRGDVDGLVVLGPEGDQVFTLKGAERSYRFFVEAMNEGAVTLALDGTILYCNNRFADMVEMPYQKIIGDSIYRFISAPDAFEPAFQRGKGDRSQTEISLKRKDNGLVPVSLSFNPMQEDEVPGVCMVVTDLTEHIRQDEVVKESEKRLRDLSSKLLAAQEEERKRISHEIHDSLGSSLAGIKFMAEKLLEKIGKSDILDDMIRSIRQTSEEARRIQSALHPSLLEDLGILATVSWFHREFQNTYSGIHIESQIDIEEKDIPLSEKIVIYRITQEALNNVAKHSEADLVHFCLRKKDKLELLIRDNGQGFHLDEKASQERFYKGIGLGSMKERAERSGGTFEIKSIIGEGTTIRVAWPISLAIDD